MAGDPWLSVFLPDYDDRDVSRTASLHNLQEQSNNALTPLTASTLEMGLGSATVSHSPESRKSSVIWYCVSCRSNLLFLDHIDAAYAYLEILNSRLISCGS